MCPDKSPSVGHQFGVPVVTAPACSIPWTLWIKVSPSHGSRHNRIPWEQICSCRSQQNASPFISISWIYVAMLCNDAVIAISSHSICEVANYAKCEIHSSPAYLICSYSICYICKKESWTGLVASWPTWWTYLTWTTRRATDTSAAAYFVGKERM